MKVCIVAEGCYPYVVGGVSSWVHSLIQQFPDIEFTVAAIVADRLVVDEETVRLRSHIAQMRSILDAPGPVGRKLDFLVQEMNREANTIGSKAQDVAIAQVVVEMKSDIEKIREQVQNIE